MTPLPEINYELPHKFLYVSVLSPTNEQIQDPVLPVNAFVIVVGVEELHLLEGLGAGETAGDGRMHQEEKVERRGACEGEERAA